MVLNHLDEYRWVYAVTALIDHPGYEITDRPTPLDIQTLAPDRGRMSLNPYVHWRLP